MRKLYTLTCVYEHRFGIDVYTSVHPSYEEAEAYADVVEMECEYDENEPEYGEYFSYSVDEHELDWL